MSEFKGFNKETVKFFKELKKNNTRRWFEEHKAEYEAHVKQPAVEFVKAMGQELRKIVPAIHAIPKVNQSLFRLNRDTRFSQDKTPYKTNMGIWFWEGMQKRMECSGFYFHLEEGNIMFGAGLYMIPNHILKPYRDAVVDPKAGKALKQMAAKLARSGLELKGKHYKRIPTGYDASHENADYLLFKGIHVGVEMKIPDLFYSPEIVPFAGNYYKQMLPLHAWLGSHVLNRKSA
ncbi:DUF2461 domain-containing protein [bacterium]|nr:DUF2461 domain-containing protein [bacterium]